MFGHHYNARPRFCLYEGKIQDYKTSLIYDPATTDPTVIDGLLVDFKALAGFLAKNEYVEAAYTGTPSEALAEVNNKLIQLEGNYTTLRNEYADLQAQLLAFRKSTQPMSEQPISEPQIATPATGSVAAETVPAPTATIEAAAPAPTI